MYFKYIFTTDLTKINSMNSVATHHKKPSLANMLLNEAKQMIRSLKKCLILFNYKFNANEYDM